MKYPYLDKIQKNGDVKKLPQQELPLLCEDIRNFLIESVSSTGGTFRPTWAWWNLRWLCTVR